MWNRVQDKKFGVALAQFHGRVLHGLPLRLGDKVQVLEEYLVLSGWYYGSLIRDPTAKGIFPASYIHLLPCTSDGSSNAADDPVLVELTAVLREWGDIWKQLYVTRQTNQLMVVRRAMLYLMDWRRELMTGTLTQDQLRDLRLRVTSKIDWGNRKLRLDLVPRQGDHVVDPDSVGVVELYHAHLDSSETSKQHSTSSSWCNSAGRPKRLESCASYQLYFCMRHFGYPSSDDIEVYFALYDMQKSRYVSERFLVKVSKEGFFSYVDKVHSNCTLFTDLGTADLAKDLYVVVQVIRLGRMLYTESASKKSHQHVYRRPLAVSVLSLSEAQQNVDLALEEKEFSLRMYQAEEKDWYQLHELIARKQSSKYSLVSGHAMCDISLKLVGGDLTTSPEHLHLFKNIPMTKKLGFPDIIMPGDVRNDLYVTLDKADFDRAGKSSSKNVLITVLLLDEAGHILPGCLSGSASQEGQSMYHSLILYHQNNPRWGDMFRVTLPTERYKSSHLRLEYYHCSTKDRTERKMFGFSFTPLMDEEETVLQDGPHDLLVYKCEDPTLLKDPNNYLNLASSVRHLNGPSPSKTSRSSSTFLFSKSAKEFVTVDLLLCSTKLTQNADLRSLLKWKEQPERIGETLNAVMRIKGEELVKFLQDVLDSLFAMFSTEDGNSTSYSGHVFQVLISILYLLGDSKFEHFKPVVDTYIQNHFAAPLIYRGLVSCVQTCAELVAVTSEQEPLQKCFATLEYVTKFVIQSRLLYVKTCQLTDEDGFKDLVHSLFAAFNLMVSETNNSIAPTQVIFLKNIFSSVIELSEILSATECVKLVQCLLDSMPKDVSQELSQARMSLILEMVKSRMFKENDARGLITVAACRQLRLHLSLKSQLSLCTQVLGEMLTYFRAESSPNTSGKVNNCLYHDIEVLCLSLLDVLMQTVLVAERLSSTGGSLVACLLGLLQILDEGHYRRLWEDFLERKPLKDFLLRSFLLLRDLVREQVFPPDWRVMHLTSNAVILNTLENLSRPIVKYFLDGGCFDSQLWSSYFDLSVAFLTQPCLQLDKLPEPKRRKILAKHGDMRVTMGFQILRMWGTLGDYKIHFVPSMVGPFLEVTLVPEMELRKATLPIFFDMMECEQKCRGSFKQVESELIDKLDLLVGDDDYRQLFNTILLEKVRSNDPIWKNRGIAFITSITKLLERLLDYRTVREGDENKDKRMSCTFNLLNFYKNEVDRRDMYVRYIYKLHDLHLPLENYTEAAFTLQLYASQLNWSTEIIPSDERFPAQPEWQRKEALYLKIVAYFDKGKCWEKGIPLAKELANFYETRLYDYGKLSHILKSQAIFYDQILTQLRPEPEFFRVGYYGTGFPLFVRNKTFVYRGLNYERIEAFTQRLQTEYPAAAILKKNTLPSEAIMNSDGQYIQICNVKPVPEDHPILDDTLNVPEKIRRFYAVNDVKTFQFDRPVHKGCVDKENEFKTLWIERTTLVTAATLPGILRWFEVVDRKVEQIPPVRFACETVSSVTRELQTLHLQYSADPKRSLHPFSMRLQGVIDAAVMGGIAKYQDAFFNAEFVNNHPEFMDYVLQLRQLITEKIRVLEQCLTLHGRLAAADLQPLHRRLQECLAHMKQRLKEWGFASPNPGRYTTSSPLHRRADSDAGIEYRKGASLSVPGAILIQPSPREDRRPQKAHTIVGGPSSNRSSGSGSSLYGHFLVNETASLISDEEDLYCKPSEILERLNASSSSSLSSTLTVSNSWSSDNRPKAPGWLDDSVSLRRDSSPKKAMTEAYLFFTPASLRDSGYVDEVPQKKGPPPRTGSRMLPPSSVSPLMHTSSTPEHLSSWDKEEAPPLPPRNNTSSWTDCTPPPIYPKRNSKKLSLSSTSTPALTPTCISPEYGLDGMNVLSTPATGPAMRYRDIVPPPLPPKATTPTAVISQSSSSLPLTSSTRMDTEQQPEFMADGSFVEEICSLLAASGCGVMTNGHQSPPRSPPPPPPEFSSVDD